MHIDEQFLIQRLAAEMNEKRKPPFGSHSDLRRIERIADRIRRREPTVEDIRFVIENREQIASLAKSQRQMATECIRISNRCEILEWNVPNDVIIDGDVAYEFFRKRREATFRSLTCKSSASVHKSATLGKNWIAYVRNDVAEKWLGSFKTRKAAEAECLSWIKTASCKNADGKPVELKDLK